MDTQLLDDILACPTLPSLPMIAVQVVELTNDPDVSMDDLAKLIQTDQALSARILRTVNSSFYGLRERCSTIRNALVLMGLSPVKSLALGFSLVKCVDEGRIDEFDYVSYWRRGLFTAVAAKSVADAAKLRIADECFISGLLQDIGMIAMLQTLREEYLCVVNSVDRHSLLAQAELDAFEASHADIGATLASRWKLPPELTVPIKYHERPTAAPDEYVQITRAVAIGSHAYGSTVEDIPSKPMKLYYKRCEAWFGLRKKEADEAYTRFTEGAAELSELFSLDTGPEVDAEELLARAEEEIVRLAEEQPRISIHSDHLSGLLQGSEGTDPLTGLPNARGFETTLEKAFGVAAKENYPISLIQVVIDGLVEVKERGGVLASDAIFIRAVAFLQQQFEPAGGAICRVGTGIISIIMPETRENQIVTAVDQFCAQYKASLPKVLAPLGMDVSHINLSVGLATADENNIGTIRTSKGLTAAATKAAVSARQAGGNCIRTFVCKKVA